MLHILMTCHLYYHQQHFRSPLILGLNLFIVDAVRKPWKLWEGLKMLCWPLLRYVLVLLSQLVPAESGNSLLVQNKLRGLSVAAVRILHYNASNHLLCAAPLYADQVFLNVTLYVIPLYILPGTSLWSLVRLDYESSESALSAAGWSRAKCNITRRPRVQQEQLVLYHN